MAAVEALSKAIITNLDTGEVIECMFRPKEYTFTKSNNWKEVSEMGSNVPKVQFRGGSAETLSLDLFFDTYESGVDVREAYTSRIWKLMKVDPGTVEKDYKGNPPLCEFRWGVMWSFKAVITSITQTFTLFLGNGIPVRAKLKVAFLQAEEIDKYPNQNPTTTSVPGYKTRRAKQAETLDWIAHDEYGDATLWRFLADANDLEDPLRLEAGRLLAIPPKP